MYAETARKRKFCWLVIGSLIVLIVLLLCSFSMGRYVISLTDVLNFLTGKNVDQSTSEVLGKLRLPRILAAALSGGALALSGTLMQGVVLNPLASPDVLGTSDAAGFGAAIGILVFSDHLGLISVSAIVGGVISVVLLYCFCIAKHDFGIVTILLSGIIISSIFKALTLGTQYVGSSNDKMPEITFWLMGSFASVQMRQVLLALPIFLIAFIWIIMISDRLNILSLGDDMAKLAGISPTRTKVVLLSISVILVAITVSMAGVISWVGLVIPHFTRRVIGPNHIYVLPLSAIFGSIFLLIIDDICRSVSASEIPVGILTALIGAPVFLIVFMMRKE